MPDQATADALIAAGVGTAGAVFGASHVVLRDSMPRKQVLATLLAAIPMGSFVPAGLVHYVAIPWGIAGLIGLALGFGCIPIVAGVQRLATKFQNKSGDIVGAFIPNQSLRDAIKDDPVTKEGQK